MPSLHWFKTASRATCASRRVRLRSPRFAARLRPLPCCGALGIAAVVMVVAACIKPVSTGTSAGSPFLPIDSEKALFWDRQTTETAELLKEFIREFNANRPGPSIEAEYIGGYGEIFRKVSASIQARKLPAMAVAYESMTAEYVLAGAVIDLESLAADPRTGLDSAARDDFFPAVLETNRYPDFGDKMFSFPFAKSVLVMYYNKRLLAEAGIDAPPKTWDEFLGQCRRIKAKTGRAAYPISVDCSTINGMIYSMGGDVVRGRETLYDSPQALKVFRLIETLSQEGLAYPITPDTYDDRIALSQDRAAFAFRSSSHRTSMETLMEGDHSRWGIAPIPQADPADPHTVLYGPNVVIFNTTPEQQRAAWAFVTFFTSPEISARWALGTGYMPVRRSVASDPGMQAFWSEWPDNRTAFDCLSYARPEPNLAGWQRVRDIVELAETSILARLKTADQAVRDLKRAADAALRQAQPDAGASPKAF